MEETSAFPGRLLSAGIGTWDFTQSAPIWESSKGQAGCTSASPSEQAHPVCTSCIWAPPRTWSNHQIPPVPPCQPQRQKGFLIPVSPCVPSQELQLGLEADRCLPPAGILMSSGRWRAVGTMLPGLIPEYFSAHRKFFVTFPLL